MEMFDAGEILALSRAEFEVGRTRLTCSRASKGTRSVPMLPLAAVTRIVGLEVMTEDELSGEVRSKRVN